MPARLHRLVGSDAATAAGTTRNLHATHLLPIRKNLTMPTELDRAIIAHRENPTEATRQAVLRAQERAHDVFLRGQTADFQRRTHEGI